MIPALFTSSSALAANQTMLSVVGNNLANSNTAGYKSQTLLFSNQFSQLISGASQPTATTGGKNPMQVGMGVQVAATDSNMTQGTFQSTGNPMDLAIQDNGYFVLQYGDQTVYTRAGAFNVDSNGTLVDPATGAKVQRVGTVGEGSPTEPAFQQVGNSDITIPQVMTIPGTATQNVYFTGNLDSNAVGPLAQVLTTGQPFTSGGTPITANTSLDDLDQTRISTTSPTGYATGDTINITGTRVDGTAVTATYTLTGTPALDNMQGLLDTINQAFMSGSPTGATATIDATGHIVLTANQPGASKASINISTGVPNSSGTSTQFSTFTQTVVGKAGDTATTVVQVYDEQGAAHNLTFTFIKSSNNTWDVKASLPASDGTIDGYGEDNTVAGIQFNPDGSLANISGNSVAEVIITKNPLTAGGVAADTSTTLESLDQHTPAGVAYGPSDVINITGVDYTGNPVGPIAVPAYDPVTGNPATVGDLINSINTAFQGGIASLDSSGNITMTATATGQTNLQLTIADDPANSGVSKTTFSSMIEQTAGTNGDNTISFNIAGLAGFGNAQTIKLNLGNPNSFSGISQTGSSNSIAVSKQDGYSQGTLKSTSIGSDGIIMGKFTNGQMIPIAQIALATFANPSGLQNNGNNYLTYTTASGLPIISSPLAGGAGSIQSGGLEGSNVDVGTEFTQLISAQRGYQVNAKAFSIANQLMQDAVDLLR